MTQRKKAIVTGASGFIGNHLVRYLKAKGYHVTGVDIKYPVFSKSEADVFLIGDLRSADIVKEVIDEPFDELYQLATDMGGAGYLFTGENDAEVMYNATMISLNVLRRSVEVGVKKIFYPSSACVYPESSEHNDQGANFREADAYPAKPGSEYGWEKLYGERLYSAFSRNYNLIVKIARFHTIYGPENVYSGGKEKVPAALARKVIAAKDHSEVEVWGDGLQTRSFLYVDECMEGMFKLMQSDDFHGPVNIGSDEEISINQLAEIYIGFSGKKLRLHHINGPQGPRNRNSDNDLIFEKLGWKPTNPTKDGLKKVYEWIRSQMSLE